MSDPFSKAPHRPTRTPSTTGGGGLTLGTSIGISGSKLQDIISRFSTLPSIEEDMAVKGPQESRKPEGQPTEITPEVLATENNNEYTKIFAEQLGWLNYFSPMMARVEAGLTEWENICDLVEAQIRKDLLDINKTVEKLSRLSAEDINIEVKTDPTYQQCLLEVQKLKQYRFQIDAYINIANRNIRVVSRQVTLRGQEMEGSNRESNVNRGTGRFGRIGR